MRKRILYLFLIIVATSVGAWAVFRFVVPKWQRHAGYNSTKLTTSAPADSWTQAIERIKADRGEPTGGNAVVDTPTELKHYSDRHWFLAAQVAEVDKHNIRMSQDFVDLAAMIDRGEMVVLPAVTDTYVLYGVGAKADDSVFTRYGDKQSIELYNEAQLGDAYGRLNDARSTLQSEIASLKAQTSKLKKRDRAKQREFQKQITALQQELKATDQKKARLDQSYVRRDSRQKLLRDYDSLQVLAKNFGGRSYDIQNPSDRHAMKITMLSSLRPEALKILEEVASAYHRRFDRPLPVSSLVRPEQYQYALNKVNRNAVLIDTPPHTTGLAFDIDYRYMSAAEQTSVMGELARLKNEGKIEAIRERNGNYHVFAFINGTRPSDQLIAASLDKATVGDHEAHHATGRAVKAKSNSPKEKRRTAKARQSKSKMRANRARRR